MKSGAGFPGGPVVDNLPASGGDMSSNPALGTKSPQAVPHDLIRKERKTGLTKNLTNKIRKSKTALRNEWENFMNVSTLFSRFHISEFNSFWNVPNPRILLFPIRKPTPFVLSVHFTLSSPLPMSISLFSMSVFPLSPCK